MKYKMIIFVLIMFLASGFSVDMSLEVKSEVVKEKSVFSGNFGLETVKSFFKKNNINIIEESENLVYEKEYESLNSWKEKTYINKLAIIDIKQNKNNTSLIIVPNTPLIFWMRGDEYTGKYIEQINFDIITSHKIVDSNTKNIITKSGINKCKWIIDENNVDKKNVMIEYSKQSFFEKNSLIIILSSILLLLISIIFGIFYKKYKKNNII